MLERLDNKILEKLTKFSHWFQKMTGLTSYFFAKTGLAIATLSSIISLLNYFSKFLHRGTDSFSIVLMVINLLGFGIILNKINRYEDNVSSEIVKLFSFSIYLRIFFICFSIYDFVTLPIILSHKDSHYFILEVIAYVGFSWGFLIFIYFIEIIPLPPGKSRIRQFIEGFFRPQVQVAPVPVKE